MSNNIRVTKPDNTPVKIQIQKPNKSGINISGISKQPTKKAPSQALQIEQPAKADTHEIQIDLPKNKGFSPTSISKTQDPPRSTSFEQFNVQKPKKSAPISFEFPKKDKIYTIEEAVGFRTLVIDFLKATSANGKLSDEDFIKMSFSISRYNFSKPDTTPRPIASNPDKKAITTELNKLTIDNFMDIIDNLTIKNKNFLGENYLKTLASSLVNQAADQPLYSSLYSLSASSINQVLDNPQYLKQRETFHTTLVNEAKARVEAQIERPSKTDVGAASFYGFLANREFASIQSALELVQKALSHPTPSTIELTIQILIPAGEKIESKFPEQSQSIFENLKAITKDKQYPGAVRYPLIDLLEARSNNWNTMHLMHKIVSTKESRNQNSNLTQVRNQSVEKPTIHIAAGSNKFANLLDDSDEDEEILVEEEDELDYNQVNAMLRGYILENEKPKWKTTYPLSDLFLAISQRPKKEMGKAINLLRIINEDNNLANTPEEKEEAYKVFVETVKKLEQDPSDPEFAIENCGAIFGVLAYFGIAAVDQFGEVFPTDHFRVGVVLSFLGEIIKVKKIHMVEESNFWMQYKWRPLDCSHLDIAMKISELDENVAEQIFEMFPVYDSISILQADIEDLLHPSAEEQPPDLKATIESFEPSTIEDPAFAIAAIELLVKANKFFDIVLPLLSQNQLTVLLWVEKYGKNELRDTQTIVKLIKQVANCGHYQLDSFMEHQGDEKHSEIVQCLKNK